MKIRWAFLKKPSVLIGAVVLFFVLLFLLNRSGGTASSGQQVVNTGPSDAQLAANTQLAMAQISAGLQGSAIQEDFAKSQDNNQTALALAAVQATLAQQQTVAQENIANETIAANVHGMDLQYQGLVDQNATALAAAQAQYNYGLSSQAITANTQLQLGQQQLQAFEIGTAAQVSEFQLGTDAQLVTSLAGKNKYSSIALPAFFAAQAGNNTATFSQVGTMA